MSGLEVGEGEGDIPVTTVETVITTNPLDEEDLDGGEVRREATCVCVFVGGV